MGAYFPRPARPNKNCRKTKTPDGWTIRRGPVLPDNHDAYFSSRHRLADTIIYSTKNSFFMPKAKWPGLLQNNR